MKKIRLISVVCAVISVCVLCVGAAENPEPVGYNQSLLNVCDYGAIPNDGKDDTLAFSITLNKNEPVYVPAGIYEISESLVVYGNSLFGSGADKTVIVAKMESVRDPIIWAGERSQIRDLTIKFDESCINGTEIAGERCGIITSAQGQRRLCRGAAVSNVRIQNVGTGIYAPVSEVLESYRTKEIIAGTSRWVGDACAFSVTFESISVIDFVWRGFSMEAINRTGNVYRNIYLSSGKYEANAGFYLDTEESETSITELTVADSKLKTAVRLNEIFGASITNLNIINTSLTEDNTGFVYFDESAVTINGLTFKNSAPVGARQSFIRVGNGAYRSYYNFPTVGYTRVYNMSILNPDTQVTPDSEQYMISRRNGYLCEYNLDIDNLRVDAPAELKAQYEAFKIDDRDLVVTVGGEVK